MERKEAIKRMQALNFIDPTVKPRPLGRGYKAVSFSNMAYSVARCTV